MLLVGRRVLFFEHVVLEFVAKSYANNIRYDNMIPALVISESNSLSSFTSALQSEQYKVIEFKKQDVAGCE